jgi:hypothetical protein
MKYFYDLEFEEDGETIKLISIGIAADDGREYYAVNSDAPWSQIALHWWLRNNVLTEIPGKLVEHTNSWDFKPDLTNTLLRPKWVIANEVKAFLYAGDDPIELWAWYGAYDHVALMQLWGSMVERPARLPMWTHDLNQKAEQCGISPDELGELVPQPHGQHHALHDALRGRDMWHYLEAPR